jgi:hypothetical protein
MLKGKVSYWFLIFLGSPGVLEFITLKHESKHEKIKSKYTHIKPHVRPHFHLLQGRDKVGTGLFQNLLMTMTNLD